MDFGISTPDSFSSSVMCIVLQEQSESPCMIQLSSHPQNPPKSHRRFHVTLKRLEQQIGFMFGTCIYQQLYFIEWYCYVPSLVINMTYSKELCVCYVVVQFYPWFKFYFSFVSNSL